MKWQKVKFLWFRWQNTHLWSWSGRRHFWQGLSVQIVSKWRCKHQKRFFASKSRKTKDKLTSRCHVQFWYFFTGFLTGGRPKWHRGNKPNLVLINGPWYLVVGHVAVPYDFGKPGKILIIHCKVSWQSFTALVFFTFRIESNYTARSWKWNVVIPKRTCTDSSA